jgi:uncharacterized protein
MFVLLSPAKKLDVPAKRLPSSFTVPEQLSETTLLMQTTKGLSSADLQGLMHISEALGDLNHERFQAWSAEHSPTTSQHAVRTFAGDTYVGLKAHTFSEDDLAYAQTHLGILSGLYGLLRPLDLMQAYRLEMGTKLTNPRGKNLYAFWKASNTQTLLARSEGVVLNCASNEYFKSLDAKALKAAGTTVITPVFLEKKDGKERTISFMAKQSRGKMAAWVMKKRVTDVEQLKTFSVGGYRFQKSKSDETKLVFSRKQPPPPSAR